MAYPAYRKKNDKVNSYARAYSRLFHLFNEWPATSRGFKRDGRTDGLLVLVGDGRHLRQERHARHAGS